MHIIIIIDVYTCTRTTCDMYENLYVYLSSAGLVAQSIAQQICLSYTHTIKLLNHTQYSHLSVANNSLLLCHLQVLHLCCQLPYQQLQHNNIILDTLPHAYMSHIELTSALVALATIVSFSHCWTASA